MKTYDIQFHDSNDSNIKGCLFTLQEAKDYINAYNGTNHSYFADYKGGIVQIVCNETGKVVHEEQVR